MIIKNYGKDGEHEFCSWCTYLQCIPTPIYSCPANAMPCQVYAKVNADNVWWYSCMGDPGGVPTKFASETPSTHMCKLGTTCSNTGNDGTALSYYMPETFSIDDSQAVQHACASLCGGYCPAFP